MLFPSFWAYFSQAGWQIWGKPSDPKPAEKQWGLTGILRLHSRVLPIHTFSFRTIFFAHVELFHLSVMPSLSQAFLTTRCRDDLCILILNLVRWRVLKFIGWRLTLEQGPSTRAWKFFNTNRHTQQGIIGRLVVLMWPCKWAPQTVPGVPQEEYKSRL